MKKNWKLKYSSRYSGRGNGWIKIDFNSPAKRIIIKKLNSFKEKGFNIDDYLSWTERAQYFWLRFYKVIGTKESPIVQFEIRINGSKKYHLENIISIPGKVANTFKLLGGTPHKLLLEVSEEERNNIQMSKKYKFKKEEISEEKEISAINFIDNNLSSIKSLPEGSAKSSYKFKLPDSSDKYLFKLFLESENAL